mmetsp:Transcript_15939/g.26836  ORF Transcript_15939/g.26836 Transcript_15939/m.26836 type:complete len:273 (-) Transcript_15939:392-1210(-)
MRRCRKQLSLRCTTDKELMERLDEVHINQLEVSSNSEIVLPSDPLALICLNTWDMGELLETQRDRSGVTAHGFTITCGAMIENMAFVLDAHGRDLPGLHIDVTFKNLYNGWVTLVVSASVLVFQQLVLSNSDVSHSVLPLMIANYKSENVEDTSNALRGLLIMKERFFSSAVELQFAAVMMDASPAIANACTNILGHCFPNSKPIILNCWFHVMKNLKKHKKKLKNADYFRPIQRDVYRLHLAPTTAMFCVLAQSLLSKWCCLGNEDQYILS